jgi:zinc protease
MKRFCAAWGLLAILSGTSLLPQQERFRKSQPPPEPLQDLKLPRIEPAVLSNQLRVVSVTRENAAFISLQLIVHAGESLSPDKLPGTATFVASLLGRGTQTRSVADVEEFVESIGGTLTVSVTQDDVFLTFHFLEEYLDSALGLLGQILLQPNFSQREIDYVKFTTTYDLLAKEKDPDFAAHRQLYRLLFQNHTYAKFAFSSEVIKSWNPDSLLDFFGRYYRPNNAEIVLSGSLNLNGATRKISQYLNLWQPRDLPAAAVEPLKLPGKDRVCLVDVPQARDCMIYMGTVLPTPRIPERFDLAVLNQLLGGTPTSRLFMNLRESKAFANFAYSQTDFFKAGGVFLVRARVRPDVVGLAVQEIQKEIRALIKEPVSGLEIEQAKSYLIFNFPLQIERYDEFSRKLAEIQARDEGEEFWSRYYEQVMSVNAERVFAAAQKFLSRPFIVVVAGDKSVLGDHLTDLESYDVVDTKGQLLSSQTKDKKGGRP